MGWLDFFRRRARPTERVGVAGFAVYGGYLQTREANRELTGRERYLTFSNLIANVSIVGASLRYFLYLVSSPRWKVEPASDSGEAGLRAAAIIEAAIRGTETPWYRIVRRGATHKFYGFSIQEWIARRMTDGSIGLLDVEARPQSTIERWDVDESGLVLGVIQRSPQTHRDIYIPREKIIHMVDDALDDSPEGLGSLRHVVGAGKKLLDLERWEAIGHEQDMAGVPVLRAPLTAIENHPNMSAEQKAALRSQLDAIAQKHVRDPNQGLVLDSLPYLSNDAAQTPSSVPQYGLELLRAGGTAHDAIGLAISRVTREIARALGTEHLMLGDSGAGSLAMAKDKSHSFALQVNATLQEVVSSFDRDLVTPLMALNGIPEELRPILKTDAIQHRSIEEVTTALRDLATAGVPLSVQDEAAGEVFDLLGLTRPEADSLLRAAFPPPEVDDASERESGNGESDHSGPDEGGRVEADDAGDPAGGEVEADSPESD